MMFDSATGNGIRLMRPEHEVMHIGGQILLASG